MHVNSKRITGLNKRLSSDLRIFIIFTYVGINYCSEGNVSVSVNKDVV